jgi:hypothetical protein
MGEPGDTQLRSSPGRALLAIYLKVPITWLLVVPARLFVTDIWELFSLLFAGRHQTGAFNERFIRAG